MRPFSALGTRPIGSAVVDVNNDGSECIIIWMCNSRGLGLSAAFHRSDATDRCRLPRSPMVAPRASWTTCRCFCSRCSPSSHPEAPPSTGPQFGPADSPHPTLLRLTHRLQPLMQPTLPLLPHPPQKPSHPASPSPCPAHPIRWSLPGVGRAALQRLWAL